MRTVANKGGDSYTVWMTREEYRELPRQTDTFEQEIAIRLMGDCGLRVAETLDVTPADISRRPDGQHFKLEVMAGKDTTGEYADGKHRETWLPREFESLINRYVQDNDLAAEDQLLQSATLTRTVQKWVERARKKAAEATGDRDYLRVSSHDLRRCWANHLLVEEHVSPRIVMALGGWNSYDAIEPYLAAPSEANITEAMDAVEL